MIKKGIDFDDILILPCNSKVEHRDDVDISVDFGAFKLSFPIIVSPMKGIISLELINVLSNLGGIGIFHRFQDKESLLKDVANAKTLGSKFGVSVSLDDSFYKVLLGYQPEILCIDVANGYLSSVQRFALDVANYIKNNNLKTLLMAGNVVEGNGTLSLVNAGVNLIRVGIGGGSLCTTRNITGIGCPQLTAIDLCSEVANKNVFIISDGGIRNSGDIVKALTFGADCVMIGGMFGRTYESSHNGLIYGMASRNLQEEYYHSVKSVEGMEMKMTKNISAKELVDELCWGIKSACTYLNARTLQQLWKQNDVYSIIEVGKGSIKGGV